MMDIKVTSTHYIKEGIAYDRVTSVLNYFSNPELVKWQLTNNRAKQISKTAKQIGTRVHNLSVVYDKTKAIRLTPNDSVSIKNCMEAYKGFCDAERPTYTETEYTVFSEKLRIAGTMDRKLVTKEVLDIKTSDKIRLNYWLQLGMYNYLDGEWAERLSVVRLDKLVGMYEYKVIAYDKRLVNVFLGLLDYYRYATSEKIVKAKQKEERRFGEVDNITYPHITTKLGLFNPEEGTNYEKWYKEI